MIPARCIVITGASSGIGAALAMHYASPGTHFVLIGRNSSRLTAVAEMCGAAGAFVQTEVIDIRDRELLEARLDALNESHPVDLLIANAGVLIGTSLGGKIEDAASAADLFATNVVGTVNTVSVVLPMMQARGSGQIAIVSSLAALSPLPDAPAYSASKAALLAYGLALRAQMAGSGISVNVICPGYVRTPMSVRQQGWRPLEISPEAAARRIAQGISQDRAVVAFPTALACLARASTFVPEPLRRLAMRPLRMVVTER